MKSGKILVALAVAFLIVALPSVAVGQEKATAEEVVAKVREAASTLSKTGDLAQFKQKQGPWVWKDTYIVVHDCDKKLIAAAARKPSGVWIEYWWPKEGSRKLSYSLCAKGTPYVVLAGIYDDKATIAELSKLTSGK